MEMFICDGLVSKLFWFDFFFGAKFICENFVYELKFVFLSYFPKNLVRFKLHNTLQKMDLGFKRRFLENE